MTTQLIPQDDFNEIAQLTHAAQLCAAQVVNAFINHKINAVCE